MTRCLSLWCPRGDSNSHVFRHRLLSSPYFSMGLVFSSAVLRTVANEKKRRQAAPVNLCVNESASPIGRLSYRLSTIKREYSVCAIYSRHKLITTTQRS